MKAQKISKFPTALAKRLKDNHSGLLNNIKKLKLRKDLNRYIKANPDKVFPGEKALIGAIGEEEALLPVLSILFKKKTLVKREIWISELRKFIIAQEATIGKPPLSVFKRLANAFRGKVKGKSLKQLKKEIGAWAKGNFDDFAKSGKGIIGSKKASLNFIKKQQAILDDEIKQIRKLKIPIKNKNELIKNLRRAKKRISIKKVLGRRTAIANIVRRSITKVRKSTRIAKRVVKRTARPVKRVVKGRKRVIKRVVTLKARPRARTKTRPRKRVPIRPRTTVRPRARVPVRPRARVPVRPRPRIKPPKKPPGKILPPIIDLNWDSKLRRGENLLVNARVRVKGKNRLIRLKTTPNRAYKRMVRLIDNTTSRSFELIVIGKAMKKDIKKQSLVKFRSKKSRASKVLKIVEKTRFAIDTKGEKSGLTIARALRKKTTKKKKRKVNKKVKRKKKRSVKK